MIRYNSGTKDNIDSDAPENKDIVTEQVDELYQPMEEKTGGGSFAIVLLLIGFIILMFVSIVVGLIIMSVGFIALLVSLL